MSNNYEVGYGRPPKETRFKAGQSGNRNGRPKGSKNKNPFDLMNKELESTLLLKDGTKITKMEALVKQFCNKASSGDFKSGKAILDMYARHEPNTLAKEFFDKLISEGYITEKNAKDYLNDGMVLNVKKIPEAVYKLFHANINKRAWAMAVLVNMISLSNIRSIFCSSEYWGAIRELVAIEYAFWQGFDRVLDSLKISGEQRAALIKKTEQERKYKRPDDYLYDAAVKTHIFWSSWTMQHFNTIRDDSKEIAGYEEAEKQWLNGEISALVLSKAKHTKSESEINDLEDALENDRANYAAFSRAPNLISKKDLELLFTEPSIEEVDTLINWYKGTSK